MCASVSSLTTEPFDIRAKKFGARVDHDDISDEFEGQGHRSKVKVAMLKNVIFEFLLG